jgi:hypothetical protein
MRRFASVLLATATAWLLAGCATVTTGTTQPINIDSDPQQAECTLTREGLALGTVTTPAPLTIKRHASTVHVVCKKPGYEDGRLVMNSRFETASAGNFLVGGIIGVMVDASSGASSRYEGNVLVRLTPMSPADQAAAAAMPKPSPSATTSSSAMPAAAPRASPEPARVAATAAPAGSFDGVYRGGLQLGALAGGNTYARQSEALRSIEVSVSGGEGTGTVRQGRCSGVGTVSLRVAPSGIVSGEMDALLSNSCAPLKVRIEARVDRDLLTGIITDGQASTEFSLRRAGSP